MHIATTSEKVIISHISEMWGRGEGKGGRSTGLIVHWSWVLFRGIEGVSDTGVWSLDRSRQYFSSKISIANLYFFLFHFIFFFKMWCDYYSDINSGKWKCGFVGTPTDVAWCCGYTPAFNTPWWPIQARFAPLPSSSTPDITTKSTRSLYSTPLPFFEKWAL